MFFFESETFTKSFINQFSVLYQHISPYFVQQNTWSLPESIKASQALVEFFCQAEYFCQQNLFADDEKERLREYMKQVILLLPQHIAYSYFHLYFKYHKDQLDHPFLGDLIEFRQEVDVLWQTSHWELNLTGSLIYRHCEWLSQIAKERDNSPFMPC